MIHRRIYQLISNTEFNIWSELETNFIELLTVENTNEKRIGDIMIHKVNGIVRRLKSGICCNRE